MTRSNPLQTTEKKTADVQFQRKFWGVIAISVLAFFAYAYALSNLFKIEPTTAAYIKIAVYITAMGLAVTSFILALRRQVDLALTIIFYFLLIVNIANPATTQGRTLNATFTMLVMGTLMIGWLLPRSAWRKNAAFLVGAIILAWVFEWIDLSWRIDTGATGAVGPTVSIIFSIVLDILVVREAWGGSIRTKVITAFTIVALVSLGILGTVTYTNFRTQVREDIRQRLINIISIAALQQDGDLHATLQTVEDNYTENYNQMIAINDAILTTDPDLEYIYTMRLNEEGQIEFILDSGNEEDYERVDVGLIYEDPSQLLAENIATLDHPIVEEEFYTDPWGTFLSAYAPIYKQDGTLEGVIGVDITADKVLAQERNVLYLILGTAGAAMVLVSLLGLWLGNLFTRPIIELSQVAQQVSDGNLNARADVKSTDEVGDLARVFNATTGQLQRILENLEQRVADRTKALETSADVSRRLAAVLDPNQLTSEVVDEIKNAFHYYYAQIYLVDATGENLVLTAGTGEEGAVLVKRGHKLPKGRGLVGRAAENNQPVLVPDTTADPDWLPNELLPETKAEAAIPIAVGDQVLGVLDVQDDVANDIDENDVTLLESLAGQVAISLRNAELYDRAETARSEAQSLVDYAAEGIAVLDLDTGLFTGPNGNMLNIFGFSLEEFEKTGPAQVSPPTQPDGRDSTEKAMEMINIAMQKGSNTFEWIHTNAQKEAFPCEIRLVRLPGEHPRVRLSLLDITERKRLEDLTRRRAEQQAALNTITQKIQAADTIEEAMQVAARELGNALGKKQTLIALDPTVSAKRQKEVVKE